MSHPPFFVSEPNLTPSRNKASLALGKAVVYEFLWVLMIFLMISLSSLAPIHLTPSRNKASLAFGETVVYEFLWVLMIFFDDITQSISTYSSDPFSQQSESRAEERIINIIILNKKTRPVEVSFSIVLAERLLATLVQPA